MIKFGILILMTGFTITAFAASENCPLQKTDTLSIACLDELASSIASDTKVTAIRTSVETNLGLALCQATAGELLWQYTADDGEVGPTLKLEQNFNCDPATGYDGYRVAGRYYLNHPEETAPSFEFLAIELIPN